MEKRIDLSIIVVNYNGLSDTLELIDSLRRHCRVAYELIVVDNGSQVDESVMIAQEEPEVITIRSEANRGFSGGNNLGLKVATGRYLLMLNNDTFVIDHSIESLVSFLDEHPTVSAVSPKIKYADAPQYIQYAGATPLSDITLRNKTMGQGELDQGQFDQALPTAFMHGAAMMIRRELLEQVGFMPENYFLYYEELDWSSQMIAHEQEIWYVPDCTIYHKESRSVGVESPLKLFYMTRNRLLYSWRNRKGLRRILSLLYLFTIIPIKSVIGYLLRGRFDLIVAVVRGTFSFLLMKDKMC